MNRNLALLIITFMLSLCASSIQSKGIYIPTQMTSDGYSATDTTKTWCKLRSRESSNIIVFWAKGYGANDPNSSKVASSYRVDIDDMLSKLELFYQENIQRLRFAGDSTAYSKSNLSKYKMVILLYYTTDWMAYGSGFDDYIGGMWVSPSTCHPVGSTIAHEIGHSFQYQCYCDLKGYVGFRYQIGKGNDYWEQTAQWQSYNLYRSEAFTSYNFTVYTKNYFRAFTHEWQRYASCFYQWYQTQKHGIDMIGRIWRSATYNGEDPNQVYMTLTGMSVKDFYKEYYDAASKLVTWDLDSLRDYGKNYIGAQQYNYVDLGGGKFQVPYSYCPQSTGYNVIPLHVPAAGTKISTVFTALPPGCNLAKGDPGKANITDTSYTAVTKYNTFSGSQTKRGFRHGYVALLKDSTRLYFNTDSVYALGADTLSDTTSIVIPENTVKLWYVVSPAPTSYFVHKWSEDETTDDQWPYQIKLLNTDIFGHINITNQAVVDTTINYTVGFDPSSTTYPATTVTVEGDEASAVGTAFQMQLTDIPSHMVTWSSTMSDNQIMFYAYKGSGVLYSSGSTANGYGHWFDNFGNMVSYPSGYVYSEFDPSTMTFTIGQYPGKCKAGDHFVIRQALRYYKNGKYARANFVFNIYIGGVPANISTIKEDNTRLNVYNIDGVLVKRGVSRDSATKGLKKGIYIINGKEIVVK